MIVFSPIIFALWYISHYIASANTKDIDTGDKFGRTPLMFCVLGDRLECAELLVKAGSDVNKRDIGGRTALHWAAHKVRKGLHKH